MARLLVVLTVCLCALSVYASETNDEFKQSLLAKLKALTNKDERRIIDCNEFKEGCSGIIPCCGTLQCYWEAGYAAYKQGECVRCVKQGQKCQRDSQCCGQSQGGTSLQCNKGNVFWVDGTCEVYRTSGSCYTDGQCVNGCSKRWWQTQGTCH